MVLFSDNVRQCYLLEKNEIVNCKIVRYFKGKSAIFMIDGVIDRTSAESLRGKFLYIKKSELPEVNQNEFYVCDLIGKQIKIRENDSICGVISGSFNFGAGDLLEISADNLKFLVPFTEENFPTQGCDTDFILITEDAWNWYKN